MVLKMKQKILFNYDETRGYSISLPIEILILFTLILPLFGFIFCIVWSLINNFEETTFTHCKVWNYLPSISAALGNHLTQYIVWCTSITLHAPSRFIFVIIYYKHNLKLLKHQKQFYVKLISLLSLTEIISLMGLSYITSLGNYERHAQFFVTFMFSSELYMLMTCIMLKYFRKNGSVDKIEVCSIRLKARLLVINFVCFLIACYFFVRHNEYCEPGIYTFFAFFEYIVVLSNIAFHSTALMDFKEKYITIHKLGFDIR